MTGVVRRIGMMQVGGACLLVLLASQAALAQRTLPETELVWQVARSGARIRTVDGGLVAEGGPRGWARSTAGFNDFVLRLEFRAMTRDAEGAVLVRAWTDAPNAWPAAGYRIALRAQPSPKETLGQLTGLSQKMGYLLARGSVDPVPAGEWQQLEVECRGDRVTVSINGRILQDGTGFESPSGNVGIEVLKGRIEIRGARVTPLVDDVPVGILRLDSNTVPIRPPVVRREVKPRYSEEAIRLGMEGTVELEAVVMPDGTVGRVWVTRSLAPHLDIEAVAAARRWQFSPALRQGVPTPIIVKIEMDFTRTAVPYVARSNR